MMRAVGVSAVTVAMTAIVPPDSAYQLLESLIKPSGPTATWASTLDMPAFNTDDCPGRPVHRWCESRAMADGWKLKYQSQSSDNIADAWWDIEVWARGHEAMLCEYRRSRGGINVNFCEPLREPRR
jgi:hypothetical protein